MVFVDWSESADSLLIFSLEGYKTESEIPVTEVIFTQNALVAEYYLSRGNITYMLSEYIGVGTKDWGIYEVYSALFEGKIKTDQDMIGVLMKGFILDSPYCFCLKISATFCWFIIDGNKCRKLGIMQFSEYESRYTVGRFIKRLRFAIADSGVNLSKVRYLCWSSDDIKGEFSRYILKYDCLEDFFGRIRGLRGLSCSNVIKILCNTIKPKYLVTAEMFVDSLNDSFKTLGIHEKDGVLYSEMVFYKDYSACVSSIMDTSSCSYGIIIDCEGVKGSDGSLENGCSELGGIIFCRHNNVLLGLDQFSCDERLLFEVLGQVIVNYRNFSSTTFKSIPIVTFGTSDRYMLMSSLKKICSKSQLRHLSSQFIFHDCSIPVYDYLGEYSGKKTLSGVAQHLEVAVVAPKHKALNDARTLFNVLAKCLEETGRLLI